jgi:hypothetical protein
MHDKNVSGRQRRHLEIAQGKDVAAGAASRSHRRIGGEKP